MKANQIHLSALCLLILSIVLKGGIYGQELNENPDLDSKVRSFLAEQRGQWYDLNVPESDGKLLYDLVIKGRYKSALEIGTSTGLSGIYIAWALSKTGGKLITVEIDEERHKAALENFRKAGLSGYIDARLADAHTFVKEVKGPFDFVFSDADKDWYKNYFLDVDPKLLPGGCYASHNVRVTGRSEYYGNRERRGYGEQVSYYEFVKSLGNYESTLNTDGGGMLISYKKTHK